MTVKTLQKKIVRASSITARMRPLASRSLAQSCTKYRSSPAMTPLTQQCSHHTLVQTQELRGLQKVHRLLLDHSKRSFARSSGNDGNPPDVEKAVTFIVNVGYDRPIAQGVADALKESGLSGDALLATARQLAGRWEVGEDEGLEALAASVKMSLSKTEGKKTIKIYVVPPNSWNSAEGEEKEKLIADLKKKTKLKKELEAIIDK